MAKSKRFKEFEVYDEEDNGVVRKATVDLGLVDGKAEHRFRYHPCGDKGCTVVIHMVNGTELELWGRARTVNRWLVEYDEWVSEGGLDAEVEDQVKRVARMEKRAAKEKARMRLAKLRADKARRKSVTDNGRLKEFSTFSIENIRSQKVQIVPADVKQVDEFEAEDYKGKVHNVARIVFKKPTQIDRDGRVNSMDRVKWVDVYDNRRVARTRLLGESALDSTDSEGK